MSELILGTAQFGDAYGATNVIGRLDDQGVRDILAEASAVRIDLFDTAADYGDAQSRLGRLGSPGARYVSKFSLDDAGKPPTTARLFGDSLAALGVHSLAGILFHRIADLRDERAGAAWRLLREARDAGLVQRIGASIYDLDDLRAAVDVLPGLDLVQVPGNLLDRRLLDSALLRRLRDGGVEVHVRSAYLQGILLAAPDALPAGLSGLAPTISRLNEVAAAEGVTLAALALSFLSHHPLVDGVLVGATTAEELRATVAAWNEVAPAEAIPDPDLPVELLDPRRWNRA